MKFRVPGSAFRVPRSSSFAKATEGRSFFVLVGLAVRELRGVNPAWPGRGDFATQDQAFVMNRPRSKPLNGMGTLMIPGSPRSARRGTCGPTSAWLRWTRRMPALPWCFRPWGWPLRALGMSRGTEARLQLGLPWRLSDPIPFLKDQRNILIGARRSSGPRPHPSRRKC